MDMPPLKVHDRITVVFGIFYCLTKFLPVTDEVCETTAKLTSIKAHWAWNKMYQKLYDKAKNLIKKDACMKFYDTSRPLNLETDASGIGLGTGLL